MLNKFEGRKANIFKDHFGECPALVSQKQWEFDQLEDDYIGLANLRRSIKTLEIGSQDGGTLWFWIRNGSGNPEYPNRFSLIVNIDRFQNKTQEQAYTLKKIWHKWAKRMNADQATIHGLSQDQKSKDKVAEYFPNGIDFLFIDGDHSYQGAKSDFEHYGAMVNEGGIIALHDICPNSSSPHIEVPRLWREIQEAGYKTRELVSEKGQNGFGIGAVYL